MYGEERLQKFVSRHARESAGGLADRLVSEIGSFTGRASLDDDLTVIALQRKTE